MEVYRAVWDNVTAYPVVPRGNNIMESLWLREMIDYLGNPIEITPFYSVI